MIDRFEILGAGSARPDADRILFCDGTDDRLFRAETDLELSHWRPNCTPTEFRADTSTEICFRFLDQPRTGPWTVAVNNHVDVDGILSVYVLLHSEPAEAWRTTIVQAAEMGDFWGWGEPPAQRLFQGLTRLIAAVGIDRQIYAHAFERIPDFIEGTDPDSVQIDDSLAPLRHAVELVETGQIVRTELGPRLAHYVIPRSVAEQANAPLVPPRGNPPSPTAYVPEFNELISPKALLWPQARARWDAERVCLVSTEHQNGWFHDLWFPGHHWADTEQLWRVPGLNFCDGMRHYQFDDPAWISAFEELQRQEHQRSPRPGEQTTVVKAWGLGGTRLPYGDELQPKFPLVGRFMDQHGQPALSQLSPAQVAALLPV